MLKNYLKIYYRHLLNNKLYSFINIIGLGIGLSSFIIIALFIKQEFSYDQFHENKENIYRVSANWNNNGAWQQIAMIPPAFGPTMTEDCFEVEDYTRFMPFPEVIIGCADKKYSESILFADGGVFSMFSFPLLQGDPSTLLQEKFTVAISETIAEKYFGERNPVGDVISFNNSFDLVVKGVFKDIPENSHISFNILVSMSTLNDEKMFGAGALDNYESSNFHTYLLLKPGINVASLEKKIEGFVSKYSGEEFTKKLSLYLESLSSIYLYSDTIYGTGISGNIKYVYIFSAIALFILLIATINFVNLTTSQSMARAKEIGIRKVTGGKRINLIGQFLGESIFLTIISFLLSLVLVEMFLPLYNSFSGNSLSVNYFTDYNFLLLLLLSAVIVGLFAGMYPAFYLSSFEPSKILKGDMIKGKKGGLFRKGLVILQFGISVILICCTLIVNEQLSFMRNKDMGFQKDNILYLQLKTPEIRSQVEAIKSELVKNTGINSVSVASRVMGAVYGGWNITSELGNKYDITTIFADEDYLKTMGLEIIAGRGLSREMTTDKENSFLINESAVKQFGWDDAVGRFVDLQGIKKGNIVGVLKDFNYRSLHKTTEPLLLTYFPGDYMKRFLTINVSGTNINGTLDYIKSTLEKFGPGQNYEVKFLDTFLNNLYRKEEQINKIVIYFSVLAIILGCLGLFGMASFAAEKRRKEIGVKKVLGAKASGIVFDLSMDFLKLIVISNIIAWPIAYLLMENWLHDFAYKIDIGIWTFIISLSASLTVALVTVSYHAVRAAIANPIESLRYE